MRESEPETPSRTRRLSAEERRQWKQVTDQTIPLRAVPEEAAEETPAAPPPPKAAPRAHPVKSVTPPPVRPAAAPPPLRSGEYAGIDRATAERFRRGQMRPSAALDLHGMTTHQAQGALASFLEQSLARGRRCVLVITGKGGRGELGAPLGTGAIRTQFPYWLNHLGFRERILAFTAAQPRDGGEGAYYVLLRRKREDA